MLLPAIAVGLMWLIMIVQALAGWDPGAWGVFPRSVWGLTGIFTSPFLHGDFGHLAANTAPFFLLATAVLYFYRPIAWKVLPLLYLLPGLWVWIASTRGPHIGASGVVYGLAFFLFFSGVFRKNLQSLTIALVVSFFYGGMVWGVLPADPHVSWEGHLFGAIAGIVTAYFLRKQGGLPEKKYKWQEQDDDGDTRVPWDYKRLYPPPDPLSYPEDRE